MNEQRARRPGPVAGGGSRAAGSVTHSPDSALFERRTGLGGPTTLGCAGATPGATRPSSLEAVPECCVHEYSSVRSVLGLGLAGGADQGGAAVPPEQLPG